MIESENKAKLARLQMLRERLRYFEEKLAELERNVRFFVSLSSLFVSLSLSLLFNLIFSFSPLFHLLLLSLLPLFHV
jgi:hypothetical protein